MNEKILEIARKSGWLHACKHGGVDSNLDEDWEKFAVDIIKECCRIVNVWTEEDGCTESTEDVFQSRCVKGSFGLPKDVYGNYL
jgi:hypothetical protein